MRKRCGGLVFSFQFSVFGFQQMPASFHCHLFACSTFSRQRGVWFSVFSFRFSANAKRSLSPARWARPTSDEWEIHRRGGGVTRRQKKEGESRKSLLEFPSASSTTNCAPFHFPRRPPFTPLAKSAGWSGLRKLNAGDEYYIRYRCRMSSVGTAGTSTMPPGTDVRSAKSKAL
jgi:hypothetical protein